MHESAAPEVVHNDVQGSTLETLVSFMYASLQNIEQQALLPLFVAADQ